MPKKESNIYHRNDGRWEGRFHISGTKKYKSVYGKTYSEAKEKLHKLQGENSISESKCRLSFNDIAQKWFAYEKSKVKASTLCCYKNKLDNHIMPFFSIKKYTDVSVDVVEKFKKQKLFEGFSSKYVSDMTVIIKSIAKWANKIYGYANKLSSVELPKAKRKKPDLLSEREQAVIQNYLFNRSDNTSLGILLSAFTGIRIGELCALKWNDIDLENKILEGLLDLALIAAPPVRIKHGVDFLMRDEIMIATTADHPVMAFAKPCESEPEQMWIDLKDTAPFEYILGPPSTVLGRTGRRSLREAGVEPLGLDTYLSASFAAAMAREGVGLAFTYRSCRIMRDEFRYLRIGKDGIFLDLALAWPAGKYRSRAAMALAKLFQEMAPELLRR